MASKSFVIEPPAQTRFRESSADPAITEGMAEAIGEGVWVTDGKTYPNDQACGNESQVYRRAVAAKIGVPEHKIRSKTWGMADGVLLTDRDAPGEYRFALTLDPNREKRSRKPKAAAAA